MRDGLFKLTEPPRIPLGGFVFSAMKFDGLSILTKRADFLAASRAGRISTPAFTLQYRARKTDEAQGIRVGFTCSKKVGNAVARNRAKRRLREVARRTLPHAGRDGFDYVLVGRRGLTDARAFDALNSDLVDALKKIHQ